MKIVEGILTLLVVAIAVFVLLAIAGYVIAGYQAQACPVSGIPEATSGLVNLLCK